MKTRDFQSTFCNLMWKWNVLLCLKFVKIIYLQNIQLWWPWNWWSNLVRLFYILLIRRSSLFSLISFTYINVSNNSTQACRITPFYEPKISCSSVMTSTANSMYVYMKNNAHNIDSRHSILFFFWRPLEAEKCQARTMEAI